MFEWILIRNIVGKNFEVSEFIYFIVYCGWIGWFGRNILFILLYIVEGLLCIIISVCDENCKIGGKCNIVKCNILWGFLIFSMFEFVSLLVSG